MSRGEVRQPSYRAEREGAKAKAKQEADRGCKEVGGRNSSRTEGSEGSKRVGGSRQTNTMRYKVMLDVAILKRPRGLVLVVFWQQRPTTSSS